MLAQARQPLGRAKLIAPIALGLFTFSSACDKVPLLAPGGTVITLFATSNTVPVNGEIEIVATAIENGTTRRHRRRRRRRPPTTPRRRRRLRRHRRPRRRRGLARRSRTVRSLPLRRRSGELSRADARTHNGQVRVRFISSGQSGTATITAFSGGASGKLENLRVGTAAVERVLLSATPQVLPPGGGTTEIAARAEDVSGAGLPGVPVTFTADQGQSVPEQPTTDSNGVARTTLTATRNAMVTANVAGKTATVNVNLNPRTGVTIAGPTTSVAAGDAGHVHGRRGNRSQHSGCRRSTSVTAAEARWARSARQRPCSTPTPRKGRFRVGATATEASGFQETVATFVTILPQQPPAVTIQASSANPALNQTVIFTAVVTGATSTILRYEWNFGDGATPATSTSTGNRATASYRTLGTKIITVRVIQASGPEGEGQTAITVGTSTVAKSGGSTERATEGQSLDIQALAFGFVDGPLRRRPALQSVRCAPLGVKESGRR